MEAPSVWRLEFREDPSRHVVLLSVTRRSGPLFFQALSERVARSEGRNAFLFLHGYKVGFADAARRTAQLAYDLSFDGAAVFYSCRRKGRSSRTPSTRPTSSGRRRTSRISSSTSPRSRMPRTCT